VGCGRWEEEDTLEIMGMVIYTESFGRYGVSRPRSLQPSNARKAGLRLLTDPTSLCARVLKGRYYPDSDFWHATRPRTSSYTWRSILHGRDLLVQGVRWGIGDGKTVKIISDNWVPGVGPGLLKPMSPIHPRQ
jgi:hypothetical protein